jgi:uncharacterized protein YkwD
MPFLRASGHRPAHRIVARTVGLAGTALLAAALLAWTPSVATGWNQSSAEATLWQLMNGDRVNNGLRPVVQNSTRVSLARGRSKDQIERDYFSHTVKGTSYQVFHWYDLNGLSYRYGGENIGWNNGYADGDSPVAVNSGFMNSPGHRANILNPDWTHGGVGAYAADNITWQGKLRSPRFYTELFMQAAGSAPPPPPSSNPPPPPRSGGGGGGGGSSRPVAAPTADEPEASEVSATMPSRPRSGQPLDGAMPVLASRERWIAPSKLAMLAYVDNWQGTFKDSPQVLASTGATHATYRVESAAAPSSGFFETVLGSLLGGALG